MSPPKIKLPNSVTANTPVFGTGSRGSIPLLGTTIGQVRLTSDNAYNLSLTITYQDISWGRAVVARWAHNPKVAGSSPAPATSRAV